MADAPPESILRWILTRYNCYYCLCPRVVEYFYKHITVSGCVISVHNIIPTFYSWFVLLAIISACFDLILGGKLKLEGGNPSAPPPPSVCNPVKGREVES